MVVVTTRSGQVYPDSQLMGVGGVDDHHRGIVEGISEG